MKNKRTLIFWLSTGLFSAMILMGAVMYFVNNEMVREAYTAVGYPTYLIYPVAIAKFLGVAAIVTRKSPFLTGMAYAGFFYLLVLGAAAHIMVDDGAYAGALIALALVIISFCTQKEMRKS